MRLMVRNSKFYYFKITKFSNFTICIIIKNCYFRAYDKQFMENVDHLFPQKYSKKPIGVDVFDPPYYSFIIQ